MRKVKIIAIGNELLRGDIVDTNSAWLATALNHIGFSLGSASLCSDNIDEIAKELEQASSKNDLILTTGGLGPTADDLTRDAVASFLGVELKKSDESLARLEANAKSRGRKLHASGHRQAYFPEGAEVFINTIGTADAFLVKKEKSVVASLPGVPKEMKLFFERDLKPWLINYYPDVHKVYAQHLRVFGLSESYLGTVVEGCDLDENVDISYRASFPEIKISFFSANQEATELAHRRVKEAIGDEFIFTESENEHLSETLFKLLKGKTLSLAESCSGGKIADRIVSTPGASEVLLASIVSYSNDAKEKFLGVRSETLKHYGAVSAEVAKEMAEGIRERTGSDYAISVTGIAGPEGGSEDKPVGSVWIGLASKGKTEAHYFCYKNERNAFRVYVATLALDLLRRLILDYPRTWETR